MNELDTLNRKGLAMLADPEALIADRGGANSMYANDPGKLRACNKWVDHARPIIQVIFAVEDAQHPITVAWLDADKWGKRRDYDEAKGYLANARKALYAMLEGIRDNFIADERCGIGNTDDETEAADQFNDWLAEHIITVDQAVRIVTDEHNAAFDRRVV